MCAGVAIRTGKSRYWFLAGLAAACGAFTHLVAWALVPAAVITLALGYLADAQGETGRWRRPPALWSPLLAMAAGGLLGAIGFYASFGFRFQDQLTLLTDYQRYTGSLSGLADPGGSFRDLVLRHFDDLSERETAEILGVSVGTVKSQNAAALARLRDGAPELLDLIGRPS